MSAMHTAHAASTKVRTHSPYDEALALKPACPACCGTGDHPSDDSDICPDCYGSGKVPPTRSELAETVGITVEYDSDRDEEYADRLAWQSDWESNSTADWPGFGWQEPEDAGPATEPDPSDLEAIRDAIDHDGFLGQEERDILAHTLPDQEYRDLEFEYWLDSLQARHESDVYEPGYCS